MSDDGRVERILDRLEVVADKLANVVGEIKVITDRQLIQNEQIGELRKALNEERNERIKVGEKLDRWINRGWGAWGLAAVLFAVITKFGWLSPQPSVQPPPAIVHEQRGPNQTGGR